MDSLVAVVAILLLAALTPGPNNFLVMAAGARGGLPAAGPLIAGVVAGGLVLLALAWSGVAVAVEAEPRVRVALAVAGGLYLARLGGRMLLESRAPSTGGLEHANGLPRTWMGVGAFQLLNPKAWILLVTAAAAMARDFEGVGGFVLLATIYALRSCLTLTVWALAGSALGGLFGGAGSGRWLERAMGGLLVASAGLLVAGAI